MSHIINYSSSSTGTITTTKYILMGHSMGCITAATVALDPTLPAKDTTLVLVAAALRPPPARDSGQEGTDGGAMAAEGPSSANAGEFEASVEAGEEVAFRGGGAGGSGVRIGGGRRGVVGTLAGVPASGLRAIGSAAAWVFNWCLLPLVYPVEVLALR